MYQDNMKYDISNNLYIILFLLLFQLVCSFCFAGNVKALLPEPYIYPAKAGSADIILPGENKIGILPIKCKSNKDLPDSSNLSLALKSISEQVKQVLGEPTVILQDVPVPEKISNKPESLALWAAENFKSQGIRTILYPRLEINKGSASMIIWRFGIPIGYDQSASKYIVCADVKLSVLVIDCELGMPIANIIGSMPYNGQNNIKNQLNDIYMLAKEVDQMILQSVNDFATECRVNRLFIQRPKIRVSKIEQGQVFLLAGLNNGIENKSEFILLAKSGNSWQKVGFLKSVNVSSNITVCSLHKEDKAKLSQATYACPIGDY